LRIRCGPERKEHFIHAAPIPAFSNNSIASGA